jgi:hypothetical protein
MIIGVIVTGVYFHDKIPSDLKWLEMWLIGGIATLITTSAPLYLIRRRRASQRPFKIHEKTFDVTIFSNPCTDGKMLQVYIGKIIPSLFSSPIQHYLLPWWLEVANISLESGLIEFGEISMSFNVKMQNNLKKVPRGLTITGEGAKQLLETKKFIDDKKYLNDCDIKHNNVFMALKAAGVVIIDN